MSAKEEQNPHCLEGEVMNVHGGPQVKWERGDTFYFMMEKHVGN